MRDGIDCSRRGAGPWLGLVVLALAGPGCGGPGSASTSAPAPTTTAEPAATDSAADLAVGAAAGSAAAVSGAGTLSYQRFASAALGVDKQFAIYLPAGYDAGTRRYPVIYLLHGLTGSQQTWPKLGLAEQADALGLEAIVVMPDGDDSFYVDWAEPVDYERCLAGKRPFGAEADMRDYCVRTPRYGQYLVNELVAHIDGAYRTIAAPRGRGIAGMSMGGYGALASALRHPDVFGAVASHAGVTALLYKGPFPYRRGAVELFDDPAVLIAGAGPFGALFRQIFGLKLDRWRALDPAALAAALTPGDAPAIYLDCGTADEFRLHNSAAYLHDVLESRGVAHAFHLIPDGKHDSEFWRARIDDSLRFFQTFFAAGG